MVTIVSFDIEGDYAAFRDPSVTTNQTVYVIPSKSAVIGILGAILGLRRPLSLGPYGPGIIYDDQFMDLLKSTMIGIRVRGGTKKISFFTNHRSLKESKTKPFKSELLLSPKYTIYVKTSDAYLKRLSERLQNNDFVYTPTLGHSYCPARILCYKEYDAEKVVPDQLMINTVVLDEMSETNSKERSFHFGRIEKMLNIVVERHLHHFFKNGELERLVLRHWIPVPTNNNDAPVPLESYSFQRNIVNFYNTESGQSLCMY